MNWVRNNRFLAVFLAVVLIGAGALGYLLYSSLGRYQQVDSDYKTQVDELKRLQALEPYPDAAEPDEVRRGAQGIHRRRDGLPGRSRQPLRRRRPARRPRPSSSRTGCGRWSPTYRASRNRPASRCRRVFTSASTSTRARPPDTAATPLLNAQLDNIANLVTLLIKTRIDKLTSVKRAPLPQEGGAATPTPAPGRPGCQRPPPRNSSANRCWKSRSRRCPVRSVIAQQHRQGQAALHRPRAGDQESGRQRPAARGGRRGTFPAAPARPRRPPRPRPTPTACPTRNFPKRGRRRCVTSSARKSST